MSDEARSLTPSEECSNCIGSGFVHDPEAEWAYPAVQHIDPYGNRWSPCPKCEGAGLAGHPDPEAIRKHEAAARAKWSADAEALNREGA